MIGRERMGFIGRISGMIIRGSTIVFELGRVGGRGEGGLVWGFVPGNEDVRAVVVTSCLSYREVKVFLEEMTFLMSSFYCFVI